MKEAVHQRALELGFDDCRITTATPPDHAVEFQKWIAQKQHGEMGYLERNAYKRVNPQEVLPGAKSVVVLATSYHLSECQMTNDKWTRENAGDNSIRHSSFVIQPIARYARFKDYHDVIGERLKQLTGFLNERGGEGTRSL